MKKNVMTAIVSGAMVGCLAIGGTFAYLTANSGTVRNTFTGTAGLGVKIAESAVDGDTYDIAKSSKGGTATADANDVITNYEITFENNGGGIDYENVVPGAEINKVVKVQVEENPTASYLFLKITKANDNYDIKDLNNQFTLVDGYTDLYVLGNNTTYTKVDSSAAAKEFDVFTTITANAEVKNADDLKNGNVEVTAFIVQAEGIANADAVKEAATGLNATAK